MLVDTFEFSCFVPSKFDAKGLETNVILSKLADSHNADQNNESCWFESHWAVIFLHPYPPLGGQYRNNVIQELSSHFATHIAATFALNMRGAGNSEGKTTWTGVSEQDDLSTIIDAISKRELPLHPRLQGSAHSKSLFMHMQAQGFIRAGPVPTQPASIQLPQISRVLLCGYSYGSVIASAISSKEYPGLKMDYALISFPYSVMWALTMHKRAQYLQRIESTITDAAVAFALQLCDSVDDSLMAQITELPSSHSTEPAGQNCNIQGIRHPKSSEADTARANTLLGTTTISRTLFISGTADSFTSLSSYEKWWSHLREKAIQKIRDRLAMSSASLRSTIIADHAIKHVLYTSTVHNADHAWYRREGDISTEIDSWWRGLSA